LNVEKKKKIIVSVINDLVTDQRVAKVCQTLHDEGYDVTLVGRVLPNSLDLIDKPYRQVRMKLFFRKGPLFYASYSIRLFFYLLFNRADILHSNDLDTLLPNYILSRLKRIPLVYDSHEYFTGVPELENNIVAKKTWKFIEKNILPKLSYCITVNHSIANLYQEEYGVEFSVVRNVPFPWKKEIMKSRQELEIPENKFIVLLQGNGINIDRGAEELVEAMRLLNNDFHLYIIGDGDVIPTLKQMVLHPDIREKVSITGKMPYDSLKQYTVNADLGVTMDKDTNINYRFSLPNKIFDYIQAGVPVLSSPLVELKKIIDDYGVGNIVRKVTPEEIANSIKMLKSNPELLAKHRKNCAFAAENLHWNTEKENILKIYSDISRNNLIL
jgi:glycosyltransferase involved in cell wall biosynthesis